MNSPPRRSTSRTTCSRSGVGRKVTSSWSIAPAYAGGRVELDLLVERQLLVHAVHPAPLDVGPTEPEAQPQQAVEDPLLGGQRMHGDGVEVRFVDRPGHLQLGAQAHPHAVQALAVQLGDRGLPRHVEAERQVVPRARIEPERPGQPLAVELLVGVVPGVAALHLDPGEQSDRDVLDVDACSPPAICTWPSRNPPGRQCGSTSTVSTDGPPTPKARNILRKTTNRSLRTRRVRNITGDRQAPM